MDVLKISQNNQQYYECPSLLWLGIAKGYSVFVTHAAAVVVCMCGCGVRACVARGKEK